MFICFIIAIKDGTEHKIVLGQDMSGVDMRSFGVFSSGTGFL